MSAMSGSVVIGGTIGGFPIGDGPVSEFRAYIAEQNQPYRDEHGRTWVSKGAYEQSIKLRKAEERIRELETSLLLEQGKQLGANFVSGVFEKDDEDGALKLSAWPSSATEYPKRLDFSMGKCDFCDKVYPVLEVDNSGGEHSYYRICQGCLNSTFDAFGKEAFGE